SPPPEFPVTRALQRGWRALHNASIAADIEARRNYLSSFSNPRSKRKLSGKRRDIPMNIVALVLAGGEGTRLYPLTAEHAKPALPFANGYRIVDFVLSNLVNSGISTIYVVAQYKPESLDRKSGV